MMTAIMVHANDCGNGRTCEGKCVTNKPNAGGKWGCFSSLAGEKPVLCNDKRFSCSTGYACKDTQCVAVDRFGAKMKPFENENAVRLPSKSLGTADHAISLCDVITDYLPSFCTCVASGDDYGGTVHCDVNLLNIDDILFSAEIEPCVNPMYALLDIQETDLGFHWSQSISAGDFEEIDVGLDIGVPGLTDAGVYVAFEIQGNIDNVDLALGLDICGKVPLIGEECGSSIPFLSDVLPVWLLNATFNFGDLCAQRDNLKLKVNGTRLMANKGMTFKAVA